MALPACRAADRLREIPRAAAHLLRLRLRLLPHRLLRLRAAAAALLLRAADALRLAPDPCETIFSMTRLVCLLAPVALYAQTGLTPAWEVKKTLEQLAAQTQRLVPVIQEIKASEWIARGAPASYVDQAKTVNDEVRYLVRTSGELARDPEKMTLALETYVRLETLDTMLLSLSEGLRRYQNPALADLIQGILGENDGQRHRLRGYLVELISTKETELRIMNDEAQRCRGMIVRPQKPVPKPAERKQNP